MAATAQYASSIQKVSVVGTGAVSDSGIGANVSFDKTIAVISPLSGATNRGIVHFAIPPPVNIYNTTKLKLKSIDVTLSPGTTNANLDVVEVWFDDDRKIRNTGLQKTKSFTVSGSDAEYTYGQGIGVTFEIQFPNYTGAVSIVSLFLTFST